MDPISQKSVIEQNIRGNRKFLVWAVRLTLFVYVVVLVCPIRYWNLEPSLDNTWVFAINQARARGMRGVIWTTGPLGPLVFPQHIGENLHHAFLFQSLVWIALAAVFTAVFFYGDFPVGNLVVFTAFFAFSTPLYWFTVHHVRGEWHNPTGLENLLLAAELALLTLAHRRDNSKCYVAALLLAGILPLIKVTAGIMAAGAVAGFVFHSWFTSRSRRLGNLILGVTIPAAIAWTGAWFMSPSASALIQYAKGTIEMSSDYSVAMSASGSAVDFAGALETLGCVGLLLSFVYRGNRRNAIFMAAILAIPMILSFKHGFVREDVHVANFFGFAALGLGLISLIMPLYGLRSMACASLTLIAYAIVWFECVLPWSSAPLKQLAGIGPVNLAWHALVRRDAAAIIDRDSAAAFFREGRLEPAILAVIRDQPVATMQIVYSNAALDHMNLELYPVVQRYGAYTPYLDGINAAWIRNHGPRFLIADWDSIDRRQPWAETPAMWLEVYRWYNTRLAAEHHLLLERRRSPRFSRLAPQGHFKTQFADGFAVPMSDQPLFWSMDCHLSAAGSIKKAFFRIPEILMMIDGRAPSRVIPEVLASPVLGNFLPDNLVQLATLLSPDRPPLRAIKQVQFRGPGIGGYDPICQVEWWRLD